MTKDEKLKRIEDIEKELAELKESIKEEEDNNQSCWRPKSEEEYYWITNYGEPLRDRWTSCSYSKERLAIGNVFRTKEEANFAIEKLKVIHELKQFAEPKERAWNSKNDHFFIEWDFTLDKIDICYNCTVKRDLIYFESIDIAHKAIEAVGEERIKKYYLEVE